MPRSCCAYGCSNRQPFKKKSERDTPSVCLHKFPLRNPKLVKKWILAVRRKNFIPDRRSCVCEAHFLESDYRVITSNRKFLKPDAVPSVFNFPPHVQKEIEKRKSSKNDTDSVKIPETDLKESIVLNFNSNCSTDEPVTFISSVEPLTENNVVCESVIKPLAEPLNKIGENYLVCEIPEGPVLGEYVSQPVPPEYIPQPVPIDLTEWVVCHDTVVPVEKSCERKLKKYKQTIKSLQLKSKRNKNKISKLQNMLKTLKERQYKYINKNDLLQEMQQDNVEEVFPQNVLAINPDIESTQVAEVVQNVLVINPDHVNTEAIEVVPQNELSSYPDLESTETIEMVSNNLLVMNPDHEGTILCQTLDFDS